MARLPISSRGGLDDVSRLVLQQNYDNMEFHGLQLFLLHFFECSNP